MTSDHAASEWQLWSTSARLVTTDPRTLPAARELADALLDEVGAAASRFRPDSELSRLNARCAEGPVDTGVSPMLEHLLHLAITAAHDTDGAVDPTVGSSLIALGYDRDIRELPTDAGPVTVARAPGWRAVGLRDRRLRLPMGVVLDLGATAKAAAADLVARQVHERLGTGVLVSLGGDIATAGPGPGGSWQVLVQDDADQPACRVGLPAGAAVATSSTARRTWQRDGRSLHHIVDPYTGLPATLIWRTVSIAAPTCAEANAASTAALVHGAKATRWLRERAFTARLVGHDGRVVLLGGWPDEHRRPAA